MILALTLILFGVLIAGIVLLARWVSGLFDGFKVDLTDDDLGL